MSRPVTLTARVAPVMGSACNGARGDIQTSRAHPFGCAKASNSTHSAALLADFKAAARGIPGTSNPNLRPAYHTAITESCCYCVPPFPAQDAWPVGGAA